MIFDNFWLDQAFIFLSYLAINIVGSIAGGGIGLIVPILVSLGYPAKGISATGKIGGWGNGLSSTINYWRKGYIDLREFWPYILLSFTGAAIGTAVFIWVDPEVYKKVIGYSVIAMIPFLIAGKHGLKNRSVNRIRRYLGYILALITEFIVFFVGSGTGIFITLNHIRVAGFEMLKSNALKRFTGIFIIPFMMVPLFLNDLIIIKYIPAMFLGGLLGGYVGSKIAIKKGNKFVKTVLIIITLISAVRIILS